ncbi:MAG: hypothetical protein KA233_00050 [Novosphingobium sp.]|nr:hypothetical protein [Novosphingobium sp.]MBP6554052.1 hypothetical protein [Novosphingobium sp.]
MTNIPAWAWAIPLIAAIIAFAGVAATITVQARYFQKQLKSSHTLKIAEMRQAWINDLRTAMAVFQSYGVTPDSNHNEVREFYETGTRIELLMNPADPDFDELQSAMYEFVGIEDTTEKFMANPKYIEICQRILKREWEVLKAELSNTEGPTES